MRSTMKRPDSRRIGVAAGASVAIAALVLLLIPGPGVEPAPEPPAAVPAPPPVQVAASPTPAPPPSAEGLRLHGLLGRGAIIATADGRQRFVAIGRDVIPGLRVERIEQGHVILASTGGELRLGFDGPAPNAVAAAAPATGPADVDAALRDETLSYRLGLAPRRAGPRTAGFVVRPGVDMPKLQRAGLRPGDVILSVNGSGFDEERMLELAWQLANTPRTEFEVERGGRRIRLALDGSRQ